MTKIRIGATELIADAIRGDQDAREAVVFHFGALAAPVLLFALCACLL